MSLARAELLAPSTSVFVGESSTLSVFKFDSAEVDLQKNEHP